MFPSLHRWFPLQSQSFRHYLLLLLFCLLFHQMDFSLLMCFLLLFCLSHSLFFYHFPIHWRAFLYLNLWVLPTTRQINRTVSSTNHDYIIISLYKQSSNNFLYHFLNSSKNSSHKLKNNSTASSSLLVISLKI